MSKASRGNSEEGPIDTLPTGDQFPDVFNETQVEPCDFDGPDRLFINVTAGSVGKNAGVQRSIRRHVMKHFRREQQASRARNLKSSPRLPASGLRGPNKEAITDSVADANLSHDQAETSKPPKDVKSPAKDMVPVGVRSPSTEESTSSTASDPLSEAPTRSDELIGAHTPRGYVQEHENMLTCCPNASWPRQLLAANGDPFVRFPTAVSKRTQRLLAHVFDGDSVSLKPYRDAFFGVALLDAASFYQYLANFALYLPKVRPQNLPDAEEYEKTEALVHQNQAIKLIVQKMASQKEVLSDGMIGAVTGMACQAHMLQDIPLWLSHMNGLTSMISMRGGVDSLNNNPGLRTAVHWLDINSASSQDKKPHYPLPLHLMKLKPSFPPHIVPTPEVLKISSQWHDKFPDRKNLAEILTEVSQFCIHLQEVTISTSKRIWSDSTFAGGFINPYIYRLLHSRSILLGGDSVSHLSEAFRSGLIMCLAEVRRAFGIYPVISQHHVTKLRMSIEAGLLAWNDFCDLGLWIIAMALLETSDHDRKFFTNEWQRMIEQRGLINIDGAEEVLSHLPWIDALHGKRLRRILGAQRPSELAGKGSPRSHSCLAGSVTTGMTYVY